MASPTAALDADVAAVGAGPAGASAAIACAQAGLRVIVFDRRGFPRDRVGETLHPGVEPVLERLGVLDPVVRAGFLRHEGIWVGTPSGSRFEPYGSDRHGPWRGFQAWRADLDAILLGRAEELGVEVIQPGRGLEPRLCAGRVVGVGTSAGELAARFVVDAAGAQHWLGRRLGLGLTSRSPRLLARYGYVRGDCPTRDEAPCFLAEPGAWTWTARVRPGVYQWARVNLTGGPPPSHPPGELRGLEPNGRPAGADVTWRSLERPAGPGYFAVGDAAAVLDPASSHGVLRALLSGMLAGQLIAAVIRRGLPEAIGEREYRAWIGSSVERDVTRLGDLYRRFPGPPGWLAGPDGARPGAPR